MKVYLAVHYYDGSGLIEDIHVISLKKENAEQYAKLNYYDDPSYGTVIERDLDE
jgi:hypothetical protein